MRICSFLILVFALGCAGSVGEGRVQYSASARQNYEKGMQRLNDEDWLESAKYFSFVKGRYPYSKYAVLAELRLADTLYGAKQYLQAIDAYKLFIKYHPTHAMVQNGYAAFRIGEAFHDMLPGDFFLVPPSFEKDQTATRDCMRASTSFLAKYPQSPYRGRAEEDSQRPAARVWRPMSGTWPRTTGTAARRRARRCGSSASSRTTPGWVTTSRALWLLGKAYSRVGRPDKAKAAWTRLVQNHPTSARARAAQKALASQGVN